MFKYYGFKYPGEQFFKPVLRRIFVFSDIHGYAEETDKTPEYEYFWVVNTLGSLCSDVVKYYIGEFTHVELLQLWKQCRKPLALVHTHPYEHGETDLPCDLPSIPDLNMAYDMDKPGVVCTVKFAIFYEAIRKVSDEKYDAIIDRYNDLRSKYPKMSVDEFMEMLTTDDILSKVFCFYAVVKQ